MRKTNLVVHPYSATIYTHLTSYKLLSGGVLGAVEAMAVAGGGFHSCHGRTRGILAVITLSLLILTHMLPGIILHIIQSVLVSGCFVPFLQCVFNLAETVKNILLLEDKV